MLEVIEKLLILQDRDRKILRLKAELNNISPQRQVLQAKAASSQGALDAAKQKAKQIESQRKELELQVESKKQLISKYGLQQFQTKKNEEYRALAHEIDNCRADIVKLEDQQIELMEQAEQAAKEVTAANGVAAELKKIAEQQVAELGEREKNLQKEVAGYESDRGALASVVEEGTLAKYERLLKHKGDNIVVGIQHSTCGGCHMKLTTQSIRSCQGHQEVITCTNCGRILYFTPDMDLTYDA